MSCQLFQAVYMQRRTEETNLKFCSTVMEICDFPHTSYVSISNAFVTNTLFPLSIITSNQTFEVVVQIILGFSEESKDALRQRRCDIGVTFQPVENKHNI